MIPVKIKFTNLVRSNSPLQRSRQINGIESDQLQNITKYNPNSQKKDDQQQQILQTNLKGTEGKINVHKFPIKTGSFLEPNQFKLIKNKSASNSKKKGIQRGLKKGEDISKNRHHYLSLEDNEQNMIKINVIQQDHQINSLSSSETAAENEIQETSPQTKPNVCFDKRFFMSTTNQFINGQNSNQKNKEYTTFPQTETKQSRSKAFSPTIQNKFHETYRQISQDSDVNFEKGISSNLNEYTPFKKKSPKLIQPIVQPKVSIQQQNCNIKLKTQQDYRQKSDMQKMESAKKQNKLEQDCTNIQLPQMENNDTEQGYNSQQQQIQNNFTDTKYKQGFPLIIKIDIPQKTSKRFSDQKQSPKSIFKKKISLSQSGSPTALKRKSKENFQDEKQDIDLCDLNQQISARQSKASKKSTKQKLNTENQQNTQQIDQQQFQQLQIQNEQVNIQPTQIQQNLQQIQENKIIQKKITQIKVNECPPHSARESLLPQNQQNEITPKLNTKYSTTFSSDTQSSSSSPPDQLSPKQNKKQIQCINLNSHKVYNSNQELQTNQKQLKSNKKQNKFKKQHQMPSQQQQETQTTQNEQQIKQDSQQKKQPQLNYQHSQEQYQEEQQQFQKETITKQESQQQQKDQYQQKVQQQNEQRQLLLKGQEKAKQEQQQQAKQEQQNQFKQEQLQQTKQVQLQQSKQEQLLQRNQEQEQEQDNLQQNNITQSKKITTISQQHKKQLQNLEKKQTESTENFQTQQKLINKRNLNENKNNTQKIFYDLPPQYTNRINFRKLSKIYFKPRNFFRDSNIFVIHFDGVLGIYDYPFFNYLQSSDTVIPEQKNDLDEQQNDNSKLSTIESFNLRQQHQKCVSGFEDEELINLDSVYYQMSQTQGFEFSKNYEQQTVNEQCIFNEQQIKIISNLKQSLKKISKLHFIIIIFPKRSPLWLDIRNYLIQQNFFCDAIYTYDSEGYDYSNYLLRNANSIFVKNSEFKVEGENALIQKNQKNELIQVNKGYAQTVYRPFSEYFKNTKDVNVSLQGNSHSKSIGQKNSELSNNSFNQNELQNQNDQLLIDYNQILVDLNLNQPKKVLIIDTIPLSMKECFSRVEDKTAANISNEQKQEDIIHNIQFLKIKQKVWRSFYLKFPKIKCHKSALRVVYLPSLHYDHKNFSKNSISFQSVLLEEIASEFQDIMNESIYITRNKQRWYYLNLDDVFDELENQKLKECFVKHMKEGLNDGICKQIQLSAFKQESDYQISEQLIKQKLHKYFSNNIKVNELISKEAEKQSQNGEQQAQNSTANSNSNNTTSKKIQSLGFQTYLNNLIDNLINRNSKIIKELQQNKDNFQQAQQVQKVYSNFYDKSSQCTSKQQQSDKIDKELDLYIARKYKSSILFYFSNLQNTLQIILFFVIAIFV